VHAVRGPGARERRMVHLRGCCEGSRGQDFVSWAVLGRLRCLEYLRGPDTKVSCLGQCWGAYGVFREYLSHCLSALCWAVLGRS